MPIPDQLAMAIALDPERVIEEEVYVRAAVEIEGRYGRGMLAIDWNHASGDPNVHIVTRVHKDAALELMQAGLSG